MLVFIVPVIIAVGTAIAKPKCSVCNSKLSWNEKCLFDEKPVCGDCGEEMPAVHYNGMKISNAGRCCKKHLASYDGKMTEKKAYIDKLIADFEKQNWARFESVKVKAWKKTYEGAVAPPRLGKRITTEKFDDKDESMTQLKMLAILDGCTQVQQVEQHRSTEEHGNFKFSVWQATGII